MFFKKLLTNFKSMNKLIVNFIQKIHHITFYQLDCITDLKYVLLGYSKSKRLFRRYVNYKKKKKISSANDKNKRKEHKF